jgi:hypothetical protein
MPIDGILSWITRGKHSLHDLLIDLDSQELCIGRIVSDVDHSACIHLKKKVQKGWLLHGVLFAAVLVLSFRIEGDPKVLHPSTAFDVGNLIRCRSVMFRQKLVVPMRIPILIDTSAVVAVPDDAVNQFLRYEFFCFRSIDS